MFVERQLLRTAALLAQLSAVAQHIGQPRGVLRDQRIQDDTSMLNKITNVCFIAACIVLTFTAITRYTSGDKMPEATEGALRGQAITRTMLPDNTPAQTVLIVMSTTCQFCEASMPFYARLQQLADRSNHAIAVVFASLEANELTTSYLFDRGIKGQTVSYGPGQLLVNGTPTLLLVNAAGVVTDGWLGQLSRRQETQLLRLLQSGTTL